MQNNEFTMKVSYWEKLLSKPNGKKWNEKGTNLNKTKKKLIDLKKII